MPRQKRIAKGNIVYHALNRANGRLRIFKKQGDFEAFEAILAEGLARFDMRLCGYCIMGTHWHLVLWPRRDGDLSAFMKWITVTHSHRWHTAHDTVGIGHLYQGRYKSFPVQDGVYYQTLMRYVESNPLRAGLVQHSADWPWGSLAIRCGEDKPVMLNDGPFSLPQRWNQQVDRVSNVPLEAIETCIQRGRPFGNDDWILKNGENAVAGIVSSPPRPTEKRRNGIMILNPEQKRCLTPFISLFYFSRNRGLLE